jgi:hypothetical protein
LETFFTSLDELADPEKVAAYVAAVGFDFKGPYREALDMRWLRSNEQTLGAPQPILMDWLEGKEKNPEALRSLCADPIVKVEGENIEIQCNIITGCGSVEEWTLKGKLGKWITLTEIMVKQIREQGTFSFADVPSDCDETTLSKH